MTDEFTYTAEQALTRSILLTAVNGASLYWARVHGYTVDCAAEQVHAEGIHLRDRSVWRVDLTDISRAVTKLIERPADCANREAISDHRTLPYVSGTLAAARQQGLTRVADLTPAEADYAPTQSRELIADVVFQLAVTDEVIR
jgi:hypothetical protein